MTGLGKIPVDPFRISVADGKNSCIIGFNCDMKSKRGGKITGVIMLFIVCNTVIALGRIKTFSTRLDCVVTCLSNFHPQHGLIMRLSQGMSAKCNAAL